MASNIEAILNCPFCGGECDPEGWLGGNGTRGPECDGCGATACSLEDWNRRAEQPSTDSMPAEQEQTMSQYASNTFVLKEIANQLRWWLDFNENGHNGAPVNDDMHVIPPTWPTRGVLKNWIAAMQARKV